MTTEGHITPTDVAANTVSSEASNIPTAAYSDNITAADTAVTSTDVAANTAIAKDPNRPVPVSHLNYSHEIEFDFSRQGTVHEYLVRRGNIMKELKDHSSSYWSIAWDSFCSRMILPNGDVEIAEDSGGVMRDMLTKFWTSFYDQCSVGFNVKVPFLRHDMSGAVWSSIGSILVVGWVKHGHFPIKLSSVFMTYCKFNTDIYGPTSPDVKA